MRGRMGRKMKNYMGRRGILETVWVLAVVLAALFLLPLRVEAAIYNYSYPTAPDKKGLTVWAGMEDDALELGVHHSTINFPISQVLATKAESNRGQSYAYKYRGKTYWFRKSEINARDRHLKKLKANNTIVTGILLMQKRSDLRSLIYPSAQSRSASCYAWNMDGGSNQRKIEATISFLARRYSSGKYGRVVGWIVGNEIDSASTWNCAGNVSFSTYMDLYARMFEMVSRIVRGVYGNARVYISLDHYWNMKHGNEYTAKECLDTFAQRMRQDGYPWHIAFHAYNADLMQPSITGPQYFPVTADDTTPIITMKNLTVLTNYVRTKYGAAHRIILSEHGYSSTWKGVELQREQSSAVALSYYLAQQNSMVDSFVYYSQVDQNELTRVGASFGLWKVSGSGKATQKKQAWTTFRAMDTDAADAAADEAAAAAQNLTGQAVVKTRTYLRSALQSWKKYRLKKKLSGNWIPCGTVSRLKKKQNGFQAVANTAENQNLYWGGQRSCKNINASRMPNLMLTVDGRRLSGAKGTLLVRVFSGDGHLLEASCPVAPRVTRLRIRLDQWKYRNRITKIQIIVKKASGKWRKGSSVTVTTVGLM